MPPKRTAAKRKQEEYELEGSEEDVKVASEEEEEKPKKKRAQSGASRSKKAVEAFTDETGWTYEPPSLFYKAYNDPQPSERIAAFDLDGTLVNTKSNLTFPKDDEDYKWFNKHTAEKLAAYHEQGYKIVLFSNQGSIKSAVTGKAATKVKGRIDRVIGELSIPVQAFFATSDDANRKPSTGMWEYFVKSCNGGVQPDLDASFFVGDAAGRAADHGDSDKKFAEAVGLPFRIPEDEFGEMDGKKALTPKKGAPPGEVAEVKVHENEGLVQAFREIAEKAFADAAFEPKAKFKGIACKKVAGVLAEFGERITLANLKEVGKLQGVGKGSLAKIKEYLETGTLAELSGVDPLAGLGKAAPVLADKGKALADKFM